MRYSRDEARRQQPDELARRAAGDEPERPEPLEQLFALQRSAGNRAVSAMLARAPDTAAPTDDKGAKTTSGPRATLPGIGTIALMSINLDVGGGAGGGGGGGSESVREITITSRQGPHSTKLHKAALDGNAMDVVISLPRGEKTVRLSLKGAIVSSYRPSNSEGEAIESWTLDFSAIKHEIEGETDESEDERPRWDDPYGPGRPTG